jgi:hypothetical protein
MKQNPGRKEHRKEQFGTHKKKGDLNRKSKHKMRTTDGMLTKSTGKTKQHLLFQKTGYHMPKEK